MHAQASCKHTLLRERMQGSQASRLLSRTVTRQSFARSGKISGSRAVYAVAADAAVTETPADATAAPDELRGSHPEEDVAAEVPYVQPHPEFVESCCFERLRSLALSFFLMIRSPVLQSQLSAISSLCGRHASREHVLHNSEILQPLPTEDPLDVCRGTQRRGQHARS